MWNIYIYIYTYMYSEKEKKKEKRKRRWDAREIFIGKRNRTWATCVKHAEMIHESALPWASNAPSTDW